MIRLENISVIYNKGESTQTIALNKLSLHVHKGDYAVIIGHNGSGKSSLLNAIAGTALPESGDIYIDGKPVTALPDYKRATYVSRIFQNPLLGTAPSLSILDNFRLAALRSKRKTLKTGRDKKFEEDVKEKISFLGMGLENHIYKPAGSLSGGQRQALTLVMSIMDDCRVLLLDEPSAALDPRSSELVMQKAGEIIQTHRLTALLVTHQMKDVLRYGNRLLVMKEGKIFADVSSAEKNQLTPEKLHQDYI